ncbi:8164_t:CDS:1, partial [Cetraspora pellucida]
NQNEFGFENQIEGENNLMMNSGGAYHEEFQENATFCEWNYVDNIFGALYDDNQAIDISSNALNNMNQSNYDMENPENDRRYELQVGMVFSDWEHAMNELRKYEKREGFRTRCYRIEKFKNGDIRRRTMVCKHFGQPEATKSKDQKKETTIKRVGCTWQINLSCPEKEKPNKVVYISKLINEHQNHELDQA